ncbi:DUF4326 domain-containing protein [Pilimelia columellifera]|uniref:DUF4326 domain-containing protein n=1 Tax=Pilimelia columellifera TaxID=706574 RepID=UPI0031DBE117
MAIASPRRVRPVRNPMPATPPAGMVHDQVDAAANYLRHLAGHPDLLAPARHELRGRDLACWCCPEVAPCHAEILLRRRRRRRGRRGSTPT